MNTRLKNLLSIALLFISFSMFAQPGSDGGRRGNDTVRNNSEVQKLTTLLNLTAEQRAKIKDILYKYAAKRKALRDRNTDREALQEALKVNNENMNGEISFLLTIDQKLKYDDYAKEREDRRRDREQRQGGQ